MSFKIVITLLDLKRIICEYGSFYDIRVNPWSYRFVGNPMEDIKNVVP